MEIRKGEQFRLPFDVKIGSDAATPQNLDGLRIQIGDRLCAWPDGDLTYDGTEEVWLYPLTAEQTSALRVGLRPAQVAVRIGDDILMTDVFDITVRGSLITEPWTEGGGDG